MDNVIEYDCCTGDSGSGHEPWCDSASFQREKSVTEEIAALRARIAELEAALTPFAKAAPEYDDLATRYGVTRFNDERHIGFLGENCPVTVGDLRRAAAILTPPTKETSR